MTTTDDTTTSPWLAIEEDARAFRLEADDMSIQLEELAAEQEALFERAKQLLIKIELNTFKVEERFRTVLEGEHALHDAVDGFGSFLDTITGKFRLHCALSALSNSCEPDCDEVIAASHGMTADQWWNHRIKEIDVRTEDTPAASL